MKTPCQSRAQPGRCIRGWSLPEVLIAAAVMGVVMAVVASALVAIRKSVEATNHYIIQTNNASRLVDYVGRDLAGALRVGQLAGTTNTPFKNASNFAITETTILTVNVPDYYAGNAPDNAIASAYKMPRYARASLAPTGYVAWANAVDPGVQLPRFAPAAATSDEIQVRYFRGPRSPLDSTTCFFRQEYPASLNTPLSAALEVAELGRDLAGSTVLLVTGLKDGTLFQVQSNFLPRYRYSGMSAVCTTQIREVAVKNRRRD